MANLQKVSRLTFIKQTVLGRGAKALYKCECGNIKEIRIANVKHGTTYSCGCYKKELDIVHGLWGNPLYVIWAGIKERCYNKNAKNYPEYGGSGVYVCDEWRSSPIKFVEWALLNGWKRGLQIDKDIKGGMVYSPENCLVVTRKINSNNKKNNVSLEYNGKKQTIQQWSEEIGIDNATLRRRLGKLKWAVETALTTPVRIYAPRK